MPKILNVPFFPQQADGYCLPACAQMVLAHLGISRSQTALGNQLGLIADAGVPAPNIIRLSSSTLDVTYASGETEELETWLTRGTPVIAFVQAGELPHHQGQLSKHAVVLIGIDEQFVYMLDPDAHRFPLQVALGDFLLAWYEMNNRYATISKRR